MSANDDSPQQSNVPDPDSDSDGLNTPWEQGGQVDGNEDGDFDSGQATWVSSPTMELHYPDAVPNEPGAAPAPPSRSRWTIPLIGGGIVIFLALVVGIALFVSNPSNSNQGGGPPAVTATETEMTTVTPTATHTEASAPTLTATLTQPPVTAILATQSGGTQQSGEQPTATVSVPSKTAPPATAPSATQSSATQAAACMPGWLPAAGCVCCGSTVVCSDGTIAPNNPACSGGGGSNCSCVCQPGYPCYDSCTNAVCTP